MMSFRSGREKPSSLLEARRAESYPYPYPTGWYRLASIDSLRRGEIRYLECLGKQFVLWRERESGEVHLMDAFCPHLGANLARGRVRGDCIECPFHQWQFAGDGSVAHIPYSERPPARVLASTYPLSDVHGDLFLFHRSEGSQDVRDGPPPYEVPRLPEVDSGRFVPRGRHSAGRVGMHIIEIAENAVDTAHFQPLHGRFRVPWTQIPIPGVEIVHTAEWMLDAEYPWVMHFDDSVILRAFGRRIGRTESKARVSYYGPGSLLVFRFDLEGWGEIVMYQTFLPISPLEQQVDFRWFADRTIPRLLVWYVIGNWMSQFPQDIEIWENKVHEPQPKLCRDDGPVYEMRRWYQQFLPNEPTSADVVKTSSPRERSTPAA
ncbi:MAG: Rieske 2Fe-2S domain-containing protein [Chloroflexi bacterium]|nr:Rieske 2Fe-2S domain-containing protein [Chloroflexota bacterium]